MILGGLDDQLGMIVWSMVSKPFFSFNNPIFLSFETLSSVVASYLNPLPTNEPLIWLLVSLSGSIIGQSFNNVFVLVTIVFNLYFSYTYFKRFKHGIVYSLIFTLSSYTWVHLGKHPDLMPLWLLPVVAKKLDSDLKYSNKDTIILALYAFIWSLVSNYMGFFLLLLILTRVFCDLTFKSNSFKKLLKFTISFLLLYIFLITAALLPYLKINYFSVSLQGYTAPLNRSVSDLVSFSSRPWYHFIPSPKNPIYHKLSENILTRLKDTGYFLTDDYFQGEHDAMFYGYLFLISYVGLFTYISIMNRKNTVNNDRQMFYKYFLMSLLLFVFTLPPFFTIFGITIYTPSYVIFKIVPLFRVTARLSIFINFTMLVSFGYGVKYLNLSKSKLFRVFAPFFLIITLLETYVPINIFDGSITPRVYEYLGTLTGSDKIIVYPYSKTKEALYFLPKHKKDLVNVRGFRNNIYDSEILTANLVTDEGIELCHSMGVRYVLVFKSVPREDLLFFSTNNNIYLEKELDDSFLYTIDALD